MGNANGREEGIGGENDDHLHQHPSAGRSNGELAVRDNNAPSTGRVASSEFMANTTPPVSPRRSASPILFPSQVSKALLFLYIFGLSCPFFFVIRMTSFDFDVHKLDLIIFNCL